ncbi:MAG: zinc ABC transporter substrate-binding protein [Clostridiaceae bacterium]|nr:zinc ABC transporter substrate-binding protein [Clostridiaceae bacterium]
MLVLTVISSCRNNNDTAADNDKTRVEDSIGEKIENNVTENNEENTEAEIDNTEDIDLKVNNNDKAENNNVKSEEKLSIVTTIFPQYDFTKQIVGDKADVKMLLKPGAESHSYEPTPQDIKTIQSSDLFIYTGGENDTWIEGIIESMGDNAPDTMKLIDMVNTVEEEIVEGMQHGHAEDHDHTDDSEHIHAEDLDHVLDDEHAEDHDYTDDGKHMHEEDHDHTDDDEHMHEDDHKHADDNNEDEDEDKHEHEHVHELDEHVWTSPINAIKIVEQITDVLSEKDPDNAEIYSTNSEAYIEQLNYLDQQFKDVVEHGKRKVILFGDRFPFRYFAEEYDLDYYAAFTGCSTDTEASAATVAFLIDKVNELQLPVVFSIELSNEKIADSIVEATAAEKLTFHSIHNLSVEELEANETYISLMEKNIEVLEKALN